jgi:uncharacterized protein DUF3501
MKPIERSEILSLGAYEQIREQFRARVMQLKRVRRVAIGSHMTALFENHDTVLLQIQEMLRTERISAESGISHELETYNELLPGANELSATVFIEYPEREERERMLSALAGVENCFFITAAGQRVAARGENRGERRDRATAVHYLKFPLTPDKVDYLTRAGAELSIGVEHPAYRAETRLNEALLESLRADFA